ncbi:MAG: hypothetical protein J6U26_02805, partial [Lachnospiraceae bacterium]|nr:hypothetical protein [Lachnospiraceae bacterium]
LTGAVNENVMPGWYEAYKLRSEDGELRLRSWQEAEEGQRYIIAAGGMGEDGAGNIVFGVIQHKTE